MKFNAFNARKKTPLLRIGLVTEPGTFTVDENVNSAELGDVLILGPDDLPIDKVDDPAAWKLAHELEIPLAAPQPDNTEPAPKPKKAKAGKKK